MASPADNLEAKSSHGLAKAHRVTDEVDPGMERSQDRVGPTTQSVECEASTAIPEKVHQFIDAASNGLPHCQSLITQEDLPQTYPAAPAASTSTVATSTTASTTTIIPRDFPRCWYCFKHLRICDGARPCSSCIKNKRTCRDVDRELLGQFPERARALLEESYLRKPSTGKGTKRAAATSHGEQNVQNVKKSKVATSTITVQSALELFKQKQATELKHCYRVINELLSDKYSDCNVHFLYPVDHVALNLPHYRSIVEFPMDLSTMKENMEDGEYKTAKEFREDFKRVVHAAKLFNQDGSEVFEAANKLDEVFKTVWDETKQLKKKKPGKKDPTAMKNSA